MSERYLVEGTIQMQHLMNKLASGKYYEVAYHCDSNINYLSKDITGECEGADHLIELATWSKKVALKGKARAEALKVLERFRLINEQAIQHMNDCNHEWLLISIDGGLFGDWLNVICKHCKSEVGLDNDRFTQSEFKKLYTPYLDKIMEEYGGYKYPNTRKLGELLPKASKEVISNYYLNNGRW